jgi:hypothetical protein
MTSSAGDPIPFAPRAAVVALLGAAVLALAACGGGGGGAGGGGGGNKQQSNSSGSSGSSPPGGTTVTSPKDGRRPAPAHTVAAQRHRVAGVESAVTRLVEASEQGNGVAACRHLGLTPKGSGLFALQDCAKRAHVDLTALPTSDELSFGPVAITGNRARVVLIGGPTLTLRRAGASWRVAGLRAQGQSGY